MRYVCLVYFEEGAAVRGLDKDARAKLNGDSEAYDAELEERATWLSRTRSKALRRR
jgi:hypothetical protein